MVLAMLFICAHDSVTVLVTRLRPISWQQMSPAPGHNVKNQVIYFLLQKLLLILSINIQKYQIVDRLMLTTIANGQFHDRNTDGKTWTSAQRDKSSVQMKRVMSIEVTITQWDSLVLSF